MKLYGLVTPSHEILLEQWLLPTLKDPYEIRIQSSPQIGQPEQHLYGSREFNQTTLVKVDLIIRAVQENMGTLFLFTDMDIQFFQETGKLLRRLMRRKDLLFQRDSPSGIPCTGFFCCRGSPETLRFWQQVRKSMERCPEKDDQQTVNELLLLGRIPPGREHSGWKIFHWFLWRKNIAGERLRRSIRFMLRLKNPYRFRWGFLPKEFFGGGTLTGKSWEPGLLLPVPKKIVLHHANWTVGVENKLAQLAYVRSVVANRRSQNLQPN